MAKARPARGRPAMSDSEKAAARTRIVAAAARLFQQEGYRAVSMRRLASEAGCTPMTLYAYFPSKTAILRHIWAQLLAALFADLAHTAAATRDPAKRLHAVSLGYVNYWLTHPDHYRMVFMTEGVTQADVGDFVADDHGGDHYRLFAEALQAVLGRTSAADLKLRTDVLVCGLHGVAHNAITISAYRWAPAKRLVAMVVAGALARP